MKNRRHWINAAKVSVAGIAVATAYGLGAGAAHADPESGSTSQHTSTQSADNSSTDSDSTQSDASTPDSDEQDPEPETSTQGGTQEEPQSTDDAEFPDSSLDEAEPSGAPTSTDTPEPSQHKEPTSQSPATSTSNTTAPPTPAVDDDHQDSSSHDVVTPRSAAVESAQPVSDSPVVSSVALPAATRSASTNIQSVQAPTLTALDTGTTYPVGGDGSVPQPTGVGYAYYASEYAYLRRKDPSGTYFYLPDNSTQYVELFNGTSGSATYSHIDSATGQVVENQTAPENPGWAPGFTDPGDDYDYYIYTNNTDSSQFVYVNGPTSATAEKSIWAQEVAPGESVAIARATEPGTYTVAEVFTRRSGNVMNVVETQSYWATDEGTAVYYRTAEQITISYEGSPAQGSGRIPVFTSTSPFITSVNSVYSSAEYDQMLGYLTDALSILGWGQVYNINNALTVLGIGREVADGNVLGAYAVAFGAGGVTLAKAGAETKNPVIYLLGEAISSTAYVVEQYSKVDFSHPSETQSYARAHPDVVIEETAKAVVQVASHTVAALVEPFGGIFKIKW